MSFNEENIEAFLTGKLNAADQLAMEAGMKNDPLLRSEVDLQKDIIESLKTNRKIQLKNRLNNIDVAATTGVSSAVKIAASFITVGIIGAGIYYMSVFSHNKENTTVVASTKISEESSSKNTADDAIVNNNSIAEQTTKTEKNSNKNTNSVNNNHISNVNSTAVANVPDGGITNEDNGINKGSTDVPTGEIDKAKVSTADNVNIDFDKKISKLNYKFYEGKLSLSKTFEDQVYDVLEFNVNSSKSKKFYLSFEGKYFELKTTSSTKAVPLKEVKEESILAKLRARNKK